MVPNIFTLGIAGLGPLTGKRLRNIGDVNRWRHNTSRPGWSTRKSDRSTSRFPAAHGLLSVWRVPRLQRLKARGRILMLPAA